MQMLGPLLVRHVRHDGAGLDDGGARGRRRRLQLRELGGVGAEVAEHLLELRGGQEHAGEVCQARVLVDERGVLRLHDAHVVDAVGEARFEPGDVFY